MTVPAGSSEASPPPRARPRVTRAAMGKRLRHLPSATLACGVLTVVSMIVGAILRGGDGAFGALAGVALVVVSYLLTGLGIAAVDIVDPNLLMPVGLAAYAAKFIAIGLVMAAVASSGWGGLVPMGVTIIAAVLVWTATQSWWTYHAKILYVETGRD